MTTVFTKQQTPTGPLLVIVAAVLWGTTGTSQALAPAEATPLTIGALRLAIGGLSLLGLAVGNGRLRPQTYWPKWSVFWAAVNVATYQIFFFAGVARAGVAIGTIVTIGSAPIWGGILGYFVRGEKPGRRWMTATMLALIGCILLAASGGQVQVDPWGLALALAAGLAYAASTTASKSVLDNQTPMAAMAVIFTLGAILLAPVLLTADLRWLAQPRGLMIVLHLGLIATGLSYLLFARGLQTVPVATTLTLALAEPLTAAALGLLVLGERLTGPAFIGIGLLFAGLFILTRNKAVE